MHQLLSIFAFLSSLVLSFAAQTPLTSPSTPTLPPPLIQVDVRQWNLSASPSVDSVSHLVFDTVASLLQHWSNSRYRNGHNVVPGIVPIGTLLYHGRENLEIPTGPEWTAVDPEHSRIFCRGAAPDCWHLTFVTTKSLRVLHFDGSSAAKLYGGTLDTQDFLAWNRTRPEWVMEEAGRLRDLCEWGKKYQLDGFSRMQVDFEVMLCDFSPLQAVSYVQLSPEGPPYRFPIMTDRGLDPPFVPQSPLGMAYKLIEAGAWHNFYPGESRIKLDLTRLVSFYDTDLFPSLVQVRSGLSRLEHRIDGISERDIQAYHDRLDEVLRDFGNDVSLSASGVDWRTLYQVIVERYADRLEMLRYILNATEPTAENYSQNYTQTMDSAMYRLHLMLTSYALQTATPPTDGRDEDRVWASPVFQHCATTHTSSLFPFRSSFSRSELLLLKALEDTNREICRVVVKLWAEGIEAGVQPSFPLREPGDEFLPVLKRWKANIDGLMGWLDWSTWRKCRPACGVEEVCYMPTWLYFKKTPWPFLKQPIDLNLIDDSEEWRNPTPRCIRILEPFDWHNP
ncbi:hypothetical protein BDN72DRAFT_894142 [Pluteus cervinus]|uniref:Uncharacterized protein n=1 Tax=Pluteus cervinus TaxID=181527 RepID=A0ACD3B5Z4_9AGAR|nr:hypothetical protein BDN72DRAFT_894142 [Pluteus cervinus]